MARSGKYFNPDLACSFVFDKILALANNYRVMPTSA
jgi:hypothetical protein